MNECRRAIVYGLVLPLCLPISCKRSEQPPGASSAKVAVSATPMVYVVNYPLKYFAERIAGDAARIVFPAPADEDPAFWRPDPETIAEYQKADLILLNGAGYAQWVQLATLPPSKVINTSRGCEDQFIEMAGAVKHVHGPEGAHTHGTIAFTTWLDPVLAVRQAQVIRDGLLKLLPDRADLINRNFQDLQNDLQSLDAQFAALAGDKRSPLLASHPVYQYFARRYGLNFESVHWEPDQVPDERQWKALDALLEQHPAEWMIWEAPPDSRTREQLSQRGIACAVFYPCGNASAGGDYLQTMRQNCDALAPVFR